MLKKFIRTTTRAALVSTSLLAISPLQSVAAAENPTNNTVIENTSQTGTEDFGDSITNTQEFVEVDNQGYIKLKDNVSQENYEKYNLGQLEEHFVNLNQKVDQNIISISSDLEIQENNNIFTIYSSGPTQEYNWWGYRTTYTNAQTNSAVSTLNAFAAGSGGAAAVGFWFPVFGAGAGLSAGYAGLLANRMDANNNGNGVLVDMTWAAVYNVSPR